MWEFTSLPDAATDVKVIYGGNTWWHKGMTKHSVDAIFYVTPTPRTDQFLRNGGFEKGSLGPWTVTNVQQAVFDSWLALNGTGSSAVLSRELTTKSPDSDVAAKIVQTRVAGSLLLYQNMPIPSVFRGKQLTFSVQVRQGVANSVRAYVGDQVATTFSTTSATTGSFVTLTATRTIDAAATTVQVGIYVDVSDTVYVDNAIANLGAVASTYQPEYWYAGAASDDIVGSRTPDQTVAAATGAWGLGTLLSMLANRVKAITGTTNWYDAPATTLAAIATSLAAKVAKAGDVMSGDLQFLSGFGVQLANAATGGRLYDISGTGTILRTEATHRFSVYTNNLLAEVFRVAYADAAPLFKGFTVWHSGNMGAASTLDSDLLDGQQGSFYQIRTNHTGTQAPSTISPQGSGSTLNADMVDSLHAASFLDLVTASQSMGVQKTLTVASGAQIKFGVTGNPDLYVIGTIGATGIKSAMVPGPDGKLHSFAATEATRMYFEDYGTGRVEGGSVHIDIPEDYWYYVDTDTDYYVWLTPHNRGQLWLEYKDTTHFIVASDQDMDFDWRITALRKDLNQERLAVIGE